MQISGALKRQGPLSSSFALCGESQAASIAFNAVTRRDGRFRQHFSLWKEFVQKFQDFRYALGVIHSRRWAHNDAAESISFDVVWQTRQLLVVHQFAPASQIERRLIFLRWKLDCQGHYQESILSG